MEIMVTGASSGVGAAAAVALASPGRRLWLLARRPEALEVTAAAVRTAGAEAAVLPCDVADPAAVMRAFATVGARLDVLVNAAALPANDVPGTPSEKIAQVVAVNLTGLMLCAREAVLRMRPARSGTIVNLGSLCVRVKDAGASLYVATKLGVAGFTDSLRKEVAADGIRVVLLNPGQIASGMVTETPEERSRMVEQEKMLTPEEVAEAIRYCVELPERVVVTEMELRPRAQSGL